MTDELTGREPQINEPADITGCEPMLGGPLGDGVGIRSYSKYYDESAMRYCVKLVLHDGREIFQSIHVLDTYYRQWGDVAADMRCKEFYDLVRYAQTEMKKRK